MTHNEFAERVCGRLCRREEIGIEDVRDAIHECLKDVRLEEESTQLVTVDEDRRGRQLAKFIACKAVEGCTAGTIRYYRGTIQRFASIMPKPFETVTTDDVRYYLAMRTRGGASKTTLNNERRILSSFYAWMTANGEMERNPMLLIKQIKQEKRVRKPFSDVEIERLRVAAQGDLRMSAVLEVLLSTGMRVSELVGLNREDLREDEVTVFGKGQKERVCYLNARSRVALDIYLRSREDDQEAMFVWDNKPHARLNKSGVEIAMRALGAKAGIGNVHPHRFRRTAATTALSRGMPIDQVQQMLGHEQIATTLIYAKVANETVKQTHRRLMG